MTRLDFPAASAHLILPYYNFPKCPKMVTFCFDMVFFFMLDFAQHKSKMVLESKNATEGLDGHL